MPASPASAARDIISHLGARSAVETPVALVVAHPDDETIGLGPLLKLLRCAHAIHLTDGARRDLRGFHAAGFHSSEEYAQARAVELARVLDLAHVPPERRHSFPIGDQEAFRHMPCIAAALGAFFQTQAIEAVFTHPYEGGHLDHDACACAVALACQRMERRGLKPPAVIEMAFYHESEHGLVTQRFCEESEEEAAIAFDQAEALVRDQMLAAHASQTAILGLFREPLARLRPAPRYDFRRPPNRGHIFYHRFIEDVTPADWLEAVQAARIWADSAQTQ
jgi:LmbE family N-acetylglucosaminyl deacetylase